MSVDTMVLEFDGISVCVAVLKFPASVGIALDPREEVHLQIREEVLYIGQVEQETRNFLEPTCNGRSFLFFDRREVTFSKSFSEAEM